MESSFTGFYYNTSLSVRNAIITHNTPTILHTFPTAQASFVIMADVIAEQVADQKAVQNRDLNGEAEDADPVEETAKKKKKKKKKKSPPATGDRSVCEVSC